MKSVFPKIIAILLLSLGLNLWAQTPYDVVKKDYIPDNKLVHDFGEILSPGDNARLENKLIAYNDSTSTQIVIVTFKSLNDYPIELLGNEIGENWGVGQKDKHNGIVIVVSDKDRKVTLRGGYGIQAKMSPSVEKLIIDREMIPSFKIGDYYQGLDKAIDAIQLQLAGQYKATPVNDESNTNWVLIAIVIIVMFFILIGFISGISNSSGGSYSDVIISNTGSRKWGSSSWGSSSWGGGSSGGGFGGFGGGSFGGGGASGSW